MCVVCLVSFICISTNSVQSFMNNVCNDPSREFVHLFMNRYQRAWPAEIAVQI